MACVSLCATFRATRGDNFAPLLTPSEANDLDTVPSMSSRVRLTTTNCLSISLQILDKCLVISGEKTRIKLHKRYQKSVYKSKVVFMNGYFF